MSSTYCIGPTADVDKPPPLWRHWQRLTELRLGWQDKCFEWRVMSLFSPASQGIAFRLPQSKPQSKRPVRLSACLVALLSDVVAPSGYNLFPNM